MKYEKLFQPGKIGNLELRNRVVMTAMGALMGDWNGCTTPEQIRFYEDRAKGGCGLIIPEFTSVDADSGHCNPIQLGIYDSRQIKSFQLICEAVHRHGAKIFIQLHHGGREAPPACNGGRQAMAPSVELNSVVGRATILPREMTIEDIDNLVEKYVQAAVNSELAGADGVEVLTPTSAPTNTAEAWKTAAASSCVSSPASAPPSAVISLSARASTAMTSSRAATISLPAPRSPNT